MHVNDRYSRQILLERIKKNGQEKLAKSHIVIIGCGALGTTIANNLARSGIGHIRVVDRDIVELNNLQRQNLFDESDIGSPKALVAAEKLRKINSEIKIDHIVDDVNFENIERVIKNMNIVLDGTDNMLVRFLINDACVKHDIPKAGSLPTCDTIGVLNTIPGIIGSIQSTEALKILLGKDINDGLLTYDVWSHNFSNIRIKKRDDCECCGKHNFEFLNAKKKETMVSLCGRGAIQIIPVNDVQISFEDLGKKLQKLGEVDFHKLVLRFKIPDYELNIFKNGRTIIIGTNDKKIAKSLYAKYIGL
jgi:adenylyltransferase/sulfurtransferase